MAASKVSKVTAADPPLRCNGLLSADSQIVVIEESKAPSYHEEELFALLNATVLIESGPLLDPPLHYGTEIPNPQSTYHHPDQLYQ